MKEILTLASSGAERFYRACDRMSPLTAFFAVMMAALLPRLYFAVTSLGPVACDEIFQTVEVGHHIAFGRGFLSWEWREGVRSHVLPAFFAAVYRLLDFLGVHDPRSLAIGVKTVLAVVHACAWAFLVPFFSSFMPRSRAFIVAFLSALAYAGAFVSARTLGEAVSLPFLIASLYGALRAIEGSAIRAGFWSGLFSGIAFALRFQSLAFAAGIFLVFLFVPGRRRALCGAFAAGLLVMVVVVGLIDLFMWGRFLHSFIEYVDYNLVHDGASRFGREPWTFYGRSFFYLYPPALTVVTFLVAFGSFSRRIALLTIPLLLYAAAHVAVPHKEVRFLFPFYALWAPIVLWAGERISRLAAAQYEALVSVGAMLGAFLFMIPSYGSGPEWARSHELNNEENMEPSFALGALPDIKEGIVLNLQVDFSGGHAYFHAPADIRYVKGAKKSEEALARDFFSTRQGVYWAVRKKDANLLAPYAAYLEEVSETEHWRVVKRDVRKRPQPREVTLRLLSHRQREGIPWDGPGTIRMYGNGLRVVLGGLRNATEIDVAVDHNDRYDITFMKGTQDVGALSIAPRPKGSGLFVHRLAVPSAAAAAGYDALVVVPSDGDGIYSIGHLFLVEEK